MCRTTTAAGVWCGGALLLTLFAMVSGFGSVPDTVPTNVKCNKIKKCDKHGICAVVCERGSVEIPLWLDRALWLQRQLSYSRSICDTQLPGSHNSGINLADGYGIEDHVFEQMLTFLPSAAVHTNDQLFSLTDQLRMGVRFLEIDVHWFDNDLRVAHCGGFHTKLLDKFVDGLNRVAQMLGLKIQWDSETIGCKPSLSSIPASEQRRVEDAIVEIAAWLTAQHNEFLIVYFDDESDLFKWHKVQRLVEYLTAHFDRNHVFTPSDRDTHAAVAQESWPTLQSLLDQRKRVMFLTGADYGAQGRDLLFYKPTVCHWQEPDLPFEPYPYCRFANPNVSAPLNGTMLRPQTSEIQYGVLNAEGHFGPNTGLLDERSIPALMDCAVNIPSPDNLTPQRMEAMVWSVMPNHVLDMTQCVVLSAATTVDTHDTHDMAGRWINHPCRSSCFAACRSLTDRSVWRQSALGMQEDQAHASCPEGFEYSVPVNGMENRVLRQVLTQDTTCVWLNVRIKREEIFQSRLKSLLPFTW